jgi:4'-phosphopantetheinyl transferase
VNTGAVTVWRIALDAARPPAAHLVAELSEAERDRAARFATDPLRNRWLHGHVAIRTILARELGIPAREIAYLTGEHGKPMLAWNGPAPIDFSFSDVESLALLAVSRAGPVGVDVEPIRENVAITPISESRFAIAERDAVRDAPEAERAARFYRIWTRKEAALKAIGVGLAQGLARFAVPVAAAPQSAAPLDIPDDRHAWLLDDLALGAPYMGSLVRREGSATPVLRA